MNLEENISKNYDIKITNIEKNLDSTDGNVYIIKTNKEKYVVKVYDDINHVKSMVKLHTYLINNNFMIPKIIKTKNKDEYLEIDNKIIVMYSFLEGIQIDNIDRTSEIIKKVAKEIRRFHDTTKDNDFLLKDVPFIKNGNDRLSALHFDLTKSNIFYNEGKIGFIDFDDAKYGPSVCDVGIAIALLFISKKRGIDNEGVKIFIDTYYSNDKELKEKELPKIKECATKWIDYVLDGHEFDTSTKESFEIKKELLKDKFLKQNIYY